MVPVGTFTGYSGNSPERKKNARRWPGRGTALVPGKKILKPSQETQNTAAVGMARVKKHNGGKKHVLKRSKIKRKK